MLLFVRYIIMMCTKPAQDRCIAKEVPLWWTFRHGVLNSLDDVNKEVVCLEIGLTFSATESFRSEDENKWKYEI